MGSLCSTLSLPIVFNVTPPPLSGPILSSQIRNWLNAASVEGLGPVRAVIAPHAGYRYCGHVMAYAYKYMNPTHMYVYLHSFQLITQS